MHDASVGDLIISHTTEHSILALMQAADLAASHVAVGLVAVGCMRVGLDGLTHSAHACHRLANGRVCAPGSGAEDGRAEEYSFILPREGCTGRACEFRNSFGVKSETCEYLLREMDGESKHIGVRADVEEVL